MEPYFASESQCFAHFDSNSDGQLNLLEFTLLTSVLFNSGQHLVQELEVESLFKYFKNQGKTSSSNSDTICDGIDKDGFSYCWNNWINIILHPKSALIIVDVQNDFVDGSLAIGKYSTVQGENGLQVLEPINELLQLKFNQVFCTMDWHPSNHISFIENVKLRKLHNSSPIQDPNDAKIGDVVIFDGNPPIEQILWPAHGVQNSFGAEYNKALNIPNDAAYIHKGTNPEIDSYSSFFDNMKLSQTTLHEELQARNITDVYFCGLAYDLCVGKSALDANELGYRTILIEDACAAIDLTRKEQVTKELVEKFGIKEQLANIKGLVEGKERRAELGYRLGLKLMKKSFEAGTSYP